MNKEVKIVMLSVDELENLNIRPADLSELTVSQYDKILDAGELSGRIYSLTGFQNAFNNEQIESYSDFMVIV